MNAVSAEIARHCPNENSEQYFIVSESFPK